MGKFSLGQRLGVLALLFSSAGFAATVTVTSDKANNIAYGDTFTLTVSGAGFPTTFGATLGLTFDPTVVQVTSFQLAPGSPFTGGTVPGAVNPPTFSSGDLVTVLAPLVGTDPSGSFDAFSITFQALTFSGAKAANIVVVDDQVDRSWTDDQTFLPIPVTYTQANVIVGVALAPVIGVTDSVAPAGDGLIPFGTVTVATVATQTVTIKNNGTADLILGALVPPSAGPYSLANDNCSGQTLAPTVPCTVDVKFAPVAVGAAPGDSLSIPSNDPNTASVVVTLSGSGSAAATPNIVVTDSVAPANDGLVAFGNVTQGQSATQTVTVTNSGSADLVLGAVAVANPLAAPYSIITDNCSNATVTPASSCTFQVRFQPAAVNTFNDTFDIPSNDPDTATVTLSVSGSGTAIPVPVAVVTDTVAPAGDQQVPFGSISVAGLSAQTVTVTNSGTAGLVIGQVAGANPLASPFSLANDTCSSQTVAPAGHCTFDVHFQPVATGPFNDSLNIPSNDPVNPTVTVSVSGTGVASTLADIKVTDSVLPATDQIVAFPDVDVNFLGHETITVTNDGAADLVIGNVAVANPLAAPFSINGDSCSGQTLAPSATCTIGVDFRPGAVQAYNDSFDIPSNDADQPTVTITLSGNGKAVPEPKGAAFDLATLFGLGLFGLVARRRRG